MAFQPVSLDFGMEFVDVIPHAQQKKLDFYINFPTCQKSVESVVMFQHTKGPFYLDRSVHTVADPRLAGDIFQ